MEVNQLTPEQRLAEIAACLAQGIVDLHKRGRLGTNAEEFPTDSPKWLHRVGVENGLVACHCSATPSKAPS